LILLFLLRLIGSVSLFSLRPRSRPPCAPAEGNRSPEPCRRAPSFSFPLRRGIFRSFLSFGWQTNFFPSGPSLRPWCRNFFRSCPSATLHVCAGDRQNFYPPMLLVLIVVAVPFGPQLHQMQAWSPPEAFYRLVFFFPHRTLFRQWLIFHPSLRGWVGFSFCDLLLSFFLVQSGLSRSEEEALFFLNVRGLAAPFLTRLFR